MAKVKLSVIKLFDNRQILCHNNCGRQLRSCSCFLEIKNKDHRNCIHSSNIIPSKTVENKNKTEQHCESENNSSKENNFTDNDDKNEKDLFENIVNDNENCNFAEKINDDHSLSSKIDCTSNSVSYDCEEESHISDIDDTSNSSWNNLSQVSLIKKCEPLTNFKCVRNEFPTVFHKFEIPQSHMNMSTDGDDVVIPIGYNRKNQDIRSQSDKCQTLATTETITEYDLESDRLNTSLVEFKCSVNDKVNLRLSSNNYHPKCTSESTSINDSSSKSDHVILYAYISDIRGVEESLILNKDRRFARLVDRYKCTVSIIQMSNMTRGFPHTLLKIVGPSKAHLQRMSREADKIHPHWNLRSQLRSVHS